jgi:hypothetical protein
MDYLIDLVLKRAILKNNETEEIIKNLKAGILITSNPAKL